MQLTSGTRLGPYEILSALGAGGMSEVYKARDTRLDRTVAIKVLPAQLADDPQFRDRFEREAKAIAALTHPHICTLYDVGHQDATEYLVMEHLEGDTLAQRLEKGALPLDQALKTAIELASALDKAHRAGIVHRDLKPGNIMLTKAGAKLLDFGLAKASAPIVSGPGLSMLPTTPPNLTAQGTILGTFQYMAPEQLEGQEADTRTDIFAFGAVLYEMLTGRKAFEGKSQASLIGAILHATPPAIATVQPLAPASLDRVVRKCLAKDADARWQSAHDLCDELQWIVDAAGAAAPSGQALRPPASVIASAQGRQLAGVVAGAVLAAVVAGGVTWRVMRSNPAAGPQVTRFAITLAPNDQFPVSTRPLVALSPDGTRLVYAANQRLYLREMDQLEATPIRGTEGPTPSPFFSPDGEWIGFWQNGQLKKVSVRGGAPVVLCTVGVPYGVSWESDGTIVFGEGPGGISRVSAAGGTPEVVVKLDQGQSAHGPQLLPGGREVLFTLNVGGNWDRAQTVVQSLDTGKRQVVTQGGRDAHYLPTGHLAYVTGGALLAVPFDVAAAKVTGGPVSLVEGVRTSGGQITGTAHFSVSRTGSLIYVPADSERRMLVWVDRQGREEPVPAEARAYRYPQLSPDGARVAVEATDQDDDLWIWEFGRANLTRLTFTPDAELSPRWTPDGRQILFESGRGSGANLYRQAADGTGVAERLTTGDGRQLPDALTPDGKTLVFRNVDSSGQTHLHVLSMEGDRASTPLLNTPFNEQNADLSPDGKWIVYQSDQSGQDEVYVRPFPRVDDGRWQISVRGGSRPVWARSGREIFYVVPSGAMMAVAVQSQDGFSAGSPAKLFEGLQYATTLTTGRHFDVSPDGRRFLMIKQVAGTTDANRVIVVEHWFEEVKRRVPATK